MDTKNKQISILFPYFEDTEYKQLTPLACHDVGLDTLCSKLADNQKEQNLIMTIISNMTKDPRVSKYRQEVFVDVLNETSGQFKSSSLIVKNEGANRSFKVMIAPPEGMSYAKDIAEKYGVTFEMLTK